MGAQTGADSKMIIGEFNAVSLFSWNNGIYLRYESINGWTFEANISHSKFNYRHKPIIWDCCWGCEAENIAGRAYKDQTIHNKLDVVTINTLAQHRVTSKKSILSDYIGLNAGITGIYSKVTTDYTFSDDPSGNINKRSAYNHTTSIHMGVSNTLSLALGKHFLVRNTFSAFANPLTLFSSHPYKPAYSANTTFQCAFGVGYLFN
jgi:hypothetical protein